MLAELIVADFAIIDELHLNFHPGFNVLTGETGAGKSIIIDAVSMLLGGRADTNFIRADTNRARVEGIFRLPDRQKALIGPILEREGLEGDDPDILILGREIRSTGRNFCRVNGSTVSLTILEEIAAPLIDIHGQSEHLSLMQVRQHQRFLDRYAGLEEQREKLAVEVRRLRRVRQELAELVRDEQRLARRVDQLSFQVEEIRAANLKPAEEAELNLERTRLANAEQLSQLAAEAYRLLAESADDQPSATDLLGQAARAIGNLVKLDETMAEQSQLVDTVTYQVEDLARSLRDYSEEIDFDPGRLQEVEERLALIFNLKRKYGNSIEEVIEFGGRAEAELESISHSEERIEELRETQEALRRDIGRMALELSQARRQAGQTLADGVVAQLADLGMERADFTVEIKWSDDLEAGVYVDAGEEGELTLACDERGIDRIEFLIAPNPGEPLKPLVKVASGGETSRIMLALKTVLAVADETPTLIFDEIDQGIGGRVGGVVGRKLRGLAHTTGHQVLCVTHLPQIAGFADNHYHVAKEVVGERTQTHIRVLTGEAQVEELAQMLGSLSDSTRESARELLQEAAGPEEASPNQPAVQDVLF